MNLTCCLFGHKWEDVVRISAKNKKWGSGKVVVRKCERCDKTDVKYEVNIEPNFPCDIEIASPSVTRKLNDEATLELVEIADETEKLEMPNKEVSKSTKRDKK